MHFAGYYVDTKVARASLRRFLGKIVIVSPTPRRESEDRAFESGLFRKYTCNRATGQFVVTLFRCTRKVAMDYSYEQTNKGTKEREREREMFSLVKMHRYRAGDKRKNATTFHSWEFL